MLRNKAKVQASTRRIFRAIRNNEGGLLRLLIDFGDLLLYKNKEKRTIFSYVALINNFELF